MEEVSGLWLLLDSILIPWTFMWYRPKDKTVSSFKGYLGAFGAYTCISRILFIKAHSILATTMVAVVSYALSWTVSKNACVMPDINYKQMASGVFVKIVIVQTTSLLVRTGSAFLGHFFVTPMTIARTNRTNSPWFAVNMGSFTILVFFYLIINFCSTSAKHKCPENSFQCNNGKCIAKRWRCDFDNDCHDNSDEEGCERPKCNQGQFACDNGRCISETFKCDADNDCRDFSDETGCPAVTCPAGKLWNCFHQFRLLNPLSQIFRRVPAANSFIRKLSAVRRAELKARIPQSIP